MDNKRRREFLKLGGNLAAALALAPMACKLMPKEEEKKKVSQAKGLESFGLQLYCLRNMIAKDPQGILKQVAAAGYRQVESFDISGLDLFAGMGNTGFAKFIGDLGMKMHSAHTDVFKDYEKKVNDLAAIGVEFIIYAWEGPE